jgi:hypothetical protein
MVDVPRPFYKRRLLFGELRCLFRRATYSRRVRVRRMQRGRGRPFHVDHALLLIEVVRYTPFFALDTGKEAGFLREAACGVCP